MRLRDIEYGRVLGASGVQGFFGEGYWFHNSLIGPDFHGATFVAKTTTLLPRPGNMPLKADFTPRELLPRSIVVKLRKGVALNAVGLSGPGAQALFETGKWQARTDPFFISFMSVAGTRAERTEELRHFVKLFGAYLPEFAGSVGLQINYSCPNVGLHVEELTEEVMTGLEIARTLGIPLMPKFNVVLPVDVAANVSEHPNCDALCVSNTIPWGQLPDLVNWEKLFGSEESPLKSLGGGGLSGRPLLPILLDWLVRATRAGVEKPINAGGGILSRRDARQVLGRADSVFLGSVAFLRPWRVQRIIRELT